MGQSGSHIATGSLLRCCSPPITGAAGGKPIHVTKSGREEEEEEVVAQIFVFAVRRPSAVASCDDTLLRAATVNLSPRGRV